MAIRVRSGEGKSYKVCKTKQMKLETFDDYIPGSVSGDHTQIIFADDTSSDMITNVSGVITILRNTNIEMSAYFNLSKILGGTDEVRIIFVNSNIFDVTKIVKQAVFNVSVNPFKFTLNFFDLLRCASEESVGLEYTLWIVREDGTTSGLVPLPIGNTQAEPSAQIEFIETTLVEI